MKTIEQKDAITVDSYTNGVVITTGEGQLHFHAAEAFELLKLLIRHFINRGTLSHATMNYAFEEQWEQREL